MSFFNFSGKNSQTRSTAPKIVRQSLLAYILHWLLVFWRCYIVVFLRW